MSGEKYYLQIAEMVDAVGCSNKAKVNPNEEKKNTTRFLDISLFNKSILLYSVHMLLYTCIIHLCILASYKNEKH